MMPVLVISQPLIQKLWAVNCDVYFHYNCNPKWILTTVNIWFLVKSYNLEKKNKTSLHPMHNYWWEIFTIPCFLSIWNIWCIIVIISNLLNSIINLHWLIELSLKIIIIPWNVCSWLLLLIHPMAINISWFFFETSICEGQWTKGIIFYDILYNLFI